MINLPTLKRFIDCFTLPRVLFVVITAYITIGYFTREKNPEWTELKGNMNGVYFAIPRELISSMPEYEGESWLEPSSIKKRPYERAYEDSVRAISLRFAQGESSVIFIVEDRDLRGKPQYQFNGLNNFRLRLLDKLSPEYLAKKPVYAYISKSPETPFDKKGYTSNVGYNIYTDAADRVWGLKWADTFGDSTAYLQTWNRNLYWTSTGTHETDIDLIICRKGNAPGVEDSPKQCQHYFYIEEWDAQIRIYYDYTNLKDWKSIKAKALSLIDSIKVTQDLQ